MAPISTTQLAEMAGVEPSYVMHLVRLRLLDTDSNGHLSERDVPRVRIVQTLEGAGLPPESLAEAQASGVVSLEFIDTPSYERWVSLAEVTFRDLSEQTGVPVEVLTTIRVAMGFAPPAADDRLRLDELEVIPLVRLQHENNFRTGVIERALRVIGESMRRVAETESDWWRDEVMMPIRQSGGAPQHLMQAMSELSPALAAASDRALMAIYHGQQTNAWMRNILEGLESALEAGGIHRAPRRVPAICFLDLTGYTRLTEERGDVVAADLARDLSSVVQLNSRQYGGTAVKWLGDGVMFHFPDPGKGVLAALDMVDATAAIGLPPAHVGLHAGPVLFQEGDYFGRTVNIASRIADYARSGEVVVSHEVVDATDVERVTFTEIGPVELKGVSGEVRLFGAHRIG